MLTTAACPMISQAAFAKSIGVSPQAVSKAIKAGRVPVYDAAGAPVAPTANGAKFIKPEEGARAFRLSRARIDDAAVAEAAADSAESGAPPAPGATLVGAKTAREQLQVDLLRLRLQRERGELVSRQAEVDALETAGRTVARILGTMPAWAEPLNGVARAGGVPALTTWLRQKANELCLQVADAVTAAGPGPDEAPDPGG